MQPRDKETHGTRCGRAAAAAAALALAAGACRGGPAASPDADPAPAPLRALPAARPSPALALEIARRPVTEIAPLLSSPDAAERRIAARALGRVGGDDAARALAAALADADPAVREEACFAIGVTGSPLAAEILGPFVAGRPSRAELAAVAAGAGHCTDDAAGALLLGLAVRDDAPVEAPEALFRHVRWRGRPWPGGLPDDRLLRWETHATSRGRAAFGWLSRIWRDPKLLPALERLTKDADPEVRRAAATGLAEGRPPAAPGAADPPKTRAAADADRAVAALSALVADRDARVVVAACRALASYDRPDAVALLVRLAGNESLHVATAACEGLGARKAKEAYGTVASLAFAQIDGVALARGERPRAAGPDSPSVRYAAAKAAFAIDPVRALELVSDLLLDPSDYVRSAAAEILAASEEPGTAARLASLAEADPGIRTREAALDGLKEKDGPEARRAVDRALAGTDAVLASVAADVAATNGWSDAAPALRSAFGRFSGSAGADAREGIVAALAKLGDPADDALVARVAASDPDPGPRGAAQAAFAEKAGVDAPKADRRPRPEGAVLPLGAALLARDVDLVVETDAGTMRIRLDAANAPVHASHLADLARKGFYDGLTWHRVVPDFVIQGGCPRGDGAGNAGVTLPLEPTRTPFERGTLGMPRSGHPDTGGCQLFVCHSRVPHLDVEYAAIGRVVEGLDVIDRIDVGSRIVRVTVAEAR